MANKRNCDRPTRRKCITRKKKLATKVAIETKWRNREENMNFNANNGANADNADINAIADFIGDNADMNVNNDGHTGDIIAGDNVDMNVTIGDLHTGHINATYTGDNIINANYTGDGDSYTGDGDSVDNIGDNIDGDNFERAGGCPNVSRFHAQSVISNSIDKIASSSVPPCPEPEGTLSMEFEESVNIDNVPPTISPPLSSAITTDSCQPLPASRMSLDMSFDYRGKQGKGMLAKNRNNKRCPTTTTTTITTEPITTSTTTNTTTTTTSNTTTNPYQYHQYYHSYF